MENKTGSSAEASAKVGKYFRYAIGEIILVVIGILIALSINNWNESRLEKIEERKLLENIKVDFQQMIIELEEKNEDRRQILEANYGLTRILIQDDFTDESTIDSLLANILGFPTFNGKSGSLNVLFNTGKINLLTNDNLKALLFLWPQEVEDMTEGELAAVSAKQAGFMPLLKKYANLNELYLIYELSGVKDRPSKIEKNYKGLFQDPSFENELFAMEGFDGLGITEAKRLIDLANEIIAIIDEELDK